MEKDNIKHINQAFADLFGKDDLILNQQNFIFDNDKAILFSNHLTSENALEIAFSLIGRVVIDASNKDLYQNSEIFRDYLIFHLKFAFNQAEGHVALKKECTLDDFLYYIE